MTNSQQLRENLLQTDEEFRQLAEQHHQLDTRLSDLSHQLHNTGNEELEQTILKKRKLQLRGRMEDIVRRSEPAHVGSPTLPPVA